MSTYETRREIAYWFGARNRKARASSCHTVDSWLAGRPPGEELSELMDAAAFEFPPDLRGWEEPKKLRRKSNSSLTTV